MPSRDIRVFTSGDCLLQEVTFSLWDHDGVAIRSELCITARNCSLIEPKKPLTVFTLRARKPLRQHLSASSGFAPALACPTGAKHFETPRVHVLQCRTTTFLNVPCQRFHPSASCQWQQLNRGNHSDRFSQPIHQTCSTSISFTQFVVYFWN